ncbi:hypothetical protein [Vibrio paracholerae]|uniref:hypothetical protein n=1 Tax=Vibrio paracholerae TaxID=650003 RepID=UPI002095CA45|nr:hypothetical protein [Vibrio paracholerae]EKO3632749.1 hypothetical protein [Vibrio metschnikovii]EKO3670994.1 hypothetical protein [Vibrio metschnikovii]MCO7030101.1 hypothetical protein [Vibrio paracholerae]
MLFVIPTENGHFNNYISLFKNRIDFEGKYILDKTSFKGFLCFILFLIKNKKRNIIFFHGEKHYLVSVLTSLIFHRILGGKVSSVFYYAYAGNSSLMKNILHRTSLLILKIAGIQAHYLELSFKNVNPNYHKFFCVLRDPVLIEFNEGAQLTNRIYDRSLSLLVAGFLDERKCIGEILDACNLLLENGHFDKVEITLLGCQSSGVESIIKNTKLHDSVFLIQKKYRFENKELIDEMTKTDIVLAIYDHHFGSSGIVINAVALNKKVAFISYGVCESFYDELNITERLNSTDPIAICSFVSSLAMCHVPQYSERNRIEFLNKRKPVNFVESLSK